MRSSEGAGRPLGAAGFPQGTNSKLIVAVRGEDGKQAALWGGLTQSSCGRVAQ